MPDGPDIRPVEGLTESAEQALRTSSISSGLAAVAARAKTARPAAAVLSARPQHPPSRPRTLADFVREVSDGSDDILDGSTRPVPVRFGDSGTAGRPSSGAGMAAAALRRLRT